MAHTFTVTVPITQLRDRDLESVDYAVTLLRALPGVSVSGWCDDDTDNEED